VASALICALASPNSVLASGSRNSAPCFVYGTFARAGNERGVRLVWLEPRVVDRLKAMRGPGESCSDAILWLAAAER
jgi:hypothetical protein